MRSVGMRPVVVHGGGPQIGELMARLGQGAGVPRRPARHRCGDARHRAHGARGQGQPRHRVGDQRARSARGRAFRARMPASSPRPHASPELGFVGDVDTVNASILERVLAQGLIPVVATIGSDVGGQAYNINADAAAGAVAEALQAEKLVYLTDVEGVRRNADDPTTLISSIAVDELEALIESGSIEGGMIPKIASCVRAVRKGVGHAHILDGRMPHALLLEIFTPEGVGTMVIAVTRLMHTYPPAAGHFRARRRARGSGTSTASPISTSSRGWPSPRSVTPTPKWPSGVRAGTHAAARLEPVRHDGRSGGRGHARPPHRRPRRAACSSATRAPRPTSARSSWPESGRGRGAMRWSAPTGRSTGARWPPCTRPVSPRSTSRSSRCPKASAMWPGTTSTRSTPASMRRSWPRSCSRPCRAKAASTPRRPPTCRACGGCATSAGAC